VISNNRKVGEVPSAYVGVTPEETHRSCEGCALRDNRGCYAWEGMNAMIHKGKHSPGFARDPDRYSLAAVLKTWRGRQARVGRIGVLGDPARAFRGELWDAIKTLRAAGLAVLAYTHFWRGRSNRNLKSDVMASCDDLEEADQALALGWRPTVILPADHQGNTFSTPGGGKGVVCPAQTKDAVTCDSCRMCDPQASVWAAGKVAVIGFLEHARGAKKPRAPLYGWRGKAGRAPEVRK
jgi:hypothetical protein